MEPCGPSLWPCPVPFLPRPPPDSHARAGKSPENPSIFRAPFLCQTRARGERGASRPREGGHPGLWRPAVPLRLRKDSARQHSSGVLGGFHGSRLITLFSFFPCKCLGPQPASDQQLVIIRVWRRACSVMGSRGRKPRSFPAPRATRKLCRGGQASLGGPGRVLRATPTRFPCAWKCSP